MAENIPPNEGPAPDPSEEGDVVGKIDQLLHRHRYKLPSDASMPGLADPSRVPEVPIADGTLVMLAQNSDGIPVLTDVVAGPGHDAKLPPVPSRSATINSVLIVRRMALALDAEHARLSAAMGGDVNQLKILDHLVAELKHALPAAVRAAIIDGAPGSFLQRDDGQL